MTFTSVSPCDEGEAEQLMAFLFFPEDFFLSMEVERSELQSITTTIGSREEEGVSNASGSDTKGFHQARAWHGYEPLRIF